MDSSFARLIGALAAPVKTFRSIAERPTWLVAFLVVMLSPLLPGILAVPKIDWEEVAKDNVGTLRLDAGRHPDARRRAANAGLTALIPVPSERSGSRS